MLNKKRIFNKTFNAGEQGTHLLNACVGNNGLVDKRSYSDGFKDAVEILTSGILNIRSKGQIDTLIYPICFCARHHIELFLKNQIELISNMRKIAPSINVGATHDLLLLWEAFQDIALATDERFDASINSIEEYVRDFAEIDPTGQTFRYPWSTDSVKHLVNTPVINIPALRTRFLELAKHFHEFEHLSDYVGYEYRYGTYTKKLSRYQLEQIAKILPQRTAWGNPEFDQIRVELKKKYKLSSRDLTEALKTIEDHTEFCSFIGMHKPIRDLTEATLYRVHLVFNNRLEMAEMPVTELIVLTAIFEIGSFRMLSEEFDNIAESTREDFNLDHCIKVSAARWAYRIQQLRQGLEKLGQLRLVEFLDENVDPKPTLDMLEIERRAWSEFSTSPIKN